MKKIFALFLLSISLFAGDYCKSKDDLSKYLDYYYQFMTMYTLLGDEKSSRANEMLFKANYFGILYADCKMTLENK